MTINITEKLPIDGQALPAFSNAFHASSGLGCISPEHVLLVDGSPTGTHMQDAPINAQVAKPFLPAVKASRFVLANLTNPDYGSANIRKCVALTTKVGH